MECLVAAGDKVEVVVAAVPEADVFAVAHVKSLEGQWKDLEFMRAGDRASRRCLVMWERGMTE